MLLRYRPASRDLKRIGSVSLSPIYAHFSDTLNGIVTIRTMKARLRFLRENEEKINQNQKAQYAGVAASQWLELRLQLLGCGKSGCPNKFYQKISLKFVMKICAKLFIQIHDFFFKPKKN